jgi:hypothetical protein
MNNNLVIIQEYDSALSETARSLNPKNKTLLQFNNFDNVIVSKDFKKNISIPRIPCLVELSIPTGYDLISHVCTTNDFHQNILSQNNIESERIDFVITPHENTLNISNIFNRYYKFGAILNAEQDSTILKDIIVLFYEATKHLNNSVLLLSIESERKNEIVELIDNLHKSMSIPLSQTKVVFTVSKNIDNNQKMSIINSIDCLLQINQVYVSDFEYYYSLIKNKRIIGKYNLNNNYSIELISYSKNIIKHNKTKNFYHQFDHHELYKKFQETSRIDTTYGITPSTNTGIQKLL